MFSFFPSRAVAFTLLDFPVHWYGIMYLLGFLMVYKLAPKLQRYRDLYLRKSDWSNLLSWVIIAVIVGGRLGYVFFYDWAYFKTSPMEIFAIWNGGMASHGGFIGVAIVAWLYARWHKISLFKLLDSAVVPIALALALGRVGNYINIELYGTVTDLPWGQSIPGIEGLRHPTAVYAILKNTTIGIICMLALTKSKKVGLPTACFVIFYAVFRFIVEFFRIPTVDNTELFGVMFTQGQLLTVPLFVLGGILLIVSLRRS
jgi:phosphatidylglycerol:prolipoprotein diacylglycerol transferase